MLYSIILFYAILLYSGLYTIARYTHVMAAEASGGSDMIRRFSEEAALGERQASLARLVEALPKTEDLRRISGTGPHCGGVPL